jgi:hypothetical protein
VASSYLILAHTHRRILRVFAQGVCEAKWKRCRRQVSSAVCARRVENLLQLFHLLAASVEPIRAPDPVEPPAEIFEDLLAQPVAFSRPKG